MSDQPLDGPSDPTLIAEMKGVREYGERLPVELRYFEENGRMVVVASNESGYGHTFIDLLDLLEWVRKGPHGSVAVEIADVPDSHP